MSADPTESSASSLTQWQRWWRNAVAVMVGLIFWATVAVHHGKTGAGLLGVDLVLGAICVLAMNYRRRWPVTMNVINALASVGSASGAAASSITFVSLCTRRRWSEMLPVAALYVACGQLNDELQTDGPGPWFADIIRSLLIAGGLIAFGLYIGARRDLIASLEDRAERAEREQSLRVLQAQTQERNRIAREMHDVLAHRMSLVAVHAGALSFRDDLSSAETRSAAEVIQANSHRALTDLREILGVLRDTEDQHGDGSIAPPDQPQPTLRDLGDLIREEQAAGARVRVHNAVTDLRGVPESVGRHAYRMVQEGLTNARKHAPATTVDVSLAGEPGAGLSVEVRNPCRLGIEPAPTPGAGLGLIGLSERAALSHGRFEHGRTPKGDFVVRAWLPWQ